MRINFILPGEDLSGGTRVVAIYARELMQKGHVVRVICPPPPPVSMRQRLRRLARGEGWKGGGSRPKSHLQNSGIDCRALERWRPVVDDDVPDGDVVIATWWETAEWVNALSPSKGAKVYFVQHHEVFPYLPVARCHATYRLPFHKIVVASWLKRVMESEYRDFKVDLVPNSVDKKQFFSSVRSKQPRPTVGFLYATAEFKGVHVSIEVIEAVRARMPQLRTVSFGSQRPTRRRPLPKTTEFFLSPPQDRIRDIYGSCDVWLTASSSEGFNLPAMEAMACGTPIVSTRTGWPEEAIRQGWNGWLADVGDELDLARGLEWVLTQQDQAWAQLSANAFSTVAQSSWEDSTTMFENALVNACRRANRGEIAGRA